MSHDHQGGLSYRNLTVFNHVQNYLIFLMISMKAFLLWEIEICIELSPLTHQNMFFLMRNRSLYWIIACYLFIFLWITKKAFVLWFDLIWFIVFNATFSNISAISWWPVLVVEEGWVPGENHRPWASNW